MARTEPVCRLHVIVLRPLDLVLAEAGYLRSCDDRKLRWVPGLDVIVRDALLAGVRMVWANAPMAKAACFLGAARMIVLAPWLYDCPGWFIRDVVSHELCHAFVRGSETSVRAMQRRMYGDLLDPVEAAPALA